MSENRIPDPLTVMLIPIPRLVIPDTGAVIPDPTPFFAVLFGLLVFGSKIRTRKNLLPQGNGICLIGFHEMYKKQF